MVRLSGIISPNIGIISPKYMVNISNYIVLSAPLLYHMIKKKTYCCLQMEDAVLRETIREHETIENKPNYNVFVAEIVTSKVTKKRLLLPDQEVTHTKEFILKYCIFCWKQLHEC